VSQPIYQRPTTYAEATIDVKKSRFIAQAYPIKTQAEAKSIIADLKEKTPNANHHCSAFIAGSPYVSGGYGLSDDGEPSGTAGRPMYSVIAGAGIGEICVVVTRFFGGTKLGTGGLVRAYSASVRELLDQLTLETVKPLLKVQLSFAYSHSAQVDSILHSSSAHIIEQTFLEMVSLIIEVEAAEKDNLLLRLQDACKGQLTIHKDS